MRAVIPRQRNRLRYITRPMRTHVFVQNNAPAEIRWGLLHPQKPQHGYIQYSCKDWDLIVRNKAAANLNTADGVSFHEQSFNLDPCCQIGLREALFLSCFAYPISANVFAAVIIVYFQKRTSRCVVKFRIFLDFNTRMLNNCVKGQNTVSLSTQGDLMRGPIEHLSAKAQYEPWMMLPDQARYHCE